MRNIILKYAHLSMRLIFFIIGNIYGATAYSMWMITLIPLRYLAPDFHWRVESLLFHITHCLMLSWLHGYKVYECGEDVSSLNQEECLVLCNHQATADTGILMKAFYNKLTTPLWVMWALFKYTHFGFMSYLRRDLFIEVGKEKRDHELVHIKEHLLTYFLPNKRKWIIVYPEGGFWYKRIESSKRYAEKNGYPLLNRVTLPRLGVVKTVLDTVAVPYKEAASSAEESSRENGYSSQTSQPEKDPNKPLKWIIDVTMAYADQSDPHDLLGMCLGWRPKTDIMLHYRLRPVESIPRDAEGLTQWLYKVYEEKDKMLEYFYTHGHLSEDMLTSHSHLATMKPGYVPYDPIQQALSHMFLMVSFYLHCAYLYLPLCSLLWQAVGAVILG